MVVKALDSWEALSYKADGLTGATAASRYGGGTASGAPTTGTWAVGDWVVAQNAVIWVCTVAGSPGTWVSTSGSGGTPAVSVTSEIPYGLATAVGTSTNYARQDHTHGSPATPVTTLAGTANQITASASTGSVTLSLPSALTTPGTLTTTGLLTANAGITVSGHVGIQGNDATSSLITATGGAGSTDARFTVTNVGVAESAILAAITTAGTLIADSAANDAVLMSTSGTLRLGVGSGQSALRVTSTDVSIYDTGNAAAKSIPRGVVYLNRQTTATVTSTTTGAFGAVVLTATGSIVLTNGRKYKVTVSGNASQATAGTGHVRVFANTANIAVGSTAAGTNIITAPVEFANGIMSIGQVNYLNVQASGGDIVGGTYFFLVAADTPNASNAITTFGTATSLGQALNVIVEDTST